MHTITSILLVILACFGVRALAQGDDDWGTAGDGRDYFLDNPALIQTPTGDAVLRPNYERYNLVSSFDATSCVPELGCEGCGAGDFANGCWLDSLFKMTRPDVQVASGERIVDLPFVCNTIFPNIVAGSSLASKFGSKALDCFVELGIAMNMQQLIPSIVMTATAEPLNVDYDGSTNIVWSAQNATSCQIVRDEEVVHSGGVTGEFTLDHVTSGGQIFVQCGRPRDSAFAQKQVSLVIGPAPAPTINISVVYPDNLSGVILGGQVQLKWEVTHAQYCSTSSITGSLSESLQQKIEGDINWLVKGPDEGIALGPIDGDFSFTVQCTNVMTPKQVTISVNSLNPD